MTSAGAVATGGRSQRLLFMVSRQGEDPRAAGGDVQGSLYAQCLAEAGHQVTYLTSSYPGAPAREERQGVRVVRLGPPPLLWLQLWSYYRRWGDRFDAVYEEAFGGARVPFCAPLYARQPLLTAWYQVNRPLFRQQYGRLGAPVLAGLERWVARLHGRATILTPTEARRRDLVGLGFRPERIFAVPPFALEWERAVAEPPPEREPLIVWLGKLRRYKCVHHAVAAMPAVAARCPQARLVIAGRREDSAYERELRQQIARLGLGGRVEFSFDLSAQAKRALLRRARAIVLSSPVEGFGIVLMEAAAEGTPCVVSEGVPEEVVEHGYNGLRVPFGDIGGIGAALSELLLSAELHAALSRNALEIARGYSRPALVARLQEVLAGAIGAAAKQPVAV